MTIHGTKPIPLPRIRECGNCQACCTRLAVDSLAKPSKQRCEHQCEKGCAIYATRPDVCAAYECAWRSGSLLERHRPDRLGVIFDSAAGPHEERLTRAAGADWIIARELFPGASQSGEAARVIRGLATRMLVLIDFFGGFKPGRQNLHGPAEMVVAATSEAERDE